MSFDLLVFLILGFAAYRVTRVLLIDTLFGGSRARLHTFLGTREGRGTFLAQKALDLSSCTWCLGFWVCLTLYSLYFWLCPLNFSRIDVINVFAVTGVQGILHAFEPGDE